MFTCLVKGIHGEEFAFLADWFVKGTFSGGTQDKGDVGKPYFEAFKGTGEKAHDVVRFGNVYVMNENGKTVAHYNLGGHELVNTPPRIGVVEDHSRSLSHAPETK